MAVSLSSLPTRSHWNENTAPSRPLPSAMPETDAVSTSPTRSMPLTATLPPGLTLLAKVIGASEGALSSDSGLPLSSVKLTVTLTKKPTSATTGV